MRESVHIKNGTCYSASPRTVALLMVWVLFLLTVPALNAGERSVSQTPIELILTADDEPWLLLAAAPVAGQLRDRGAVPILMAVSSEPGGGCGRLLERLGPLSCSTTVVTLRRDIERFGAGLNRRASFIVAQDVSAATLLLARRYWRQTDTVVLSHQSEPGLAITAATLAAHRGIPFLVYDTRIELARISACLEELGVTSVIVLADSSGLGQFRDRYAMVELSERALVEQTIKRLGATTIRNVILTRAPDVFAGEGASSWMAPYLSVMRRAPVSLCASSSAIDAEVGVFALIDSYGLRPATVTILADEASIGTLSATDPDCLGDYEVNIEPCSRPFDGRAAAYGVGRIPFERLADASLMIATGLARDVLIQDQRPQVLMIANPGGGALPLAELVSRATSEEFKNFGLSISEHYARAADSTEIVDTAVGAHMIVYEGHISDQRLFQYPYDAYEVYEEDYSERKGLFDYRMSTGSVREPGDYPDSYQEQDLTSDEPRHEESYTTTAVELRESPDAPATLDRLEGSPVVVLQSCHSLESSTVDLLLDLGAVAMVGSSTSVHSASGSAFVKTFCDGLLYRSGTTGEALRDARNYFLCLGKLKQQRGHRETTKVYRAGLTFRLWGDPEVRVFPSAVKPKRPGIVAEMVGPDRLQISTPKHRLPVSTNEKYFARMFPGSQLAGLVKRQKKEPVRRLLPIYFFRLPRPPDFDVEGYRYLKREGDTDPRAVHLADPLGRFVYIVYFPKEEARSDAFVLQFTE